MTGCVLHWMRLYACMHVSVYVCVCVCVFVCIYVCMNECMFVYVCVYVYVYACMYVFMHVCMNVSLVCMYLPEDVCSSPIYPDATPLSTAIPTASR